MNQADIYNHIYNWFPLLWLHDQRPELFASIFENPSLHVAWNYFLLNAGLVLVALLWGTGFAGVLIQKDKNLKSAIHLSAFAFICTGLGFALMIAEIFILVLVHSLTPHAVIFLTAVTSGIAFYTAYLYRHDMHRIITPFSESSTILTFLVLLMLIIFQISSAAPWMICDATSYHLPYADFFLQNKGITSVPESLIYPYQSLNINMLYSVAMMVNRELSYLQTIHALFGTMAAFGVYVFCVNSGQRLFLAVLMPTLFISKISIALYYRSAALVDNGSMYFILCSIFTLYLWIKNQSPWLLVTSAINFGLAIGTKYLMWIFAAPIALCLLVFEGRNWRPLATYIIWAAAWGLWWYIRNLILTGNPVHPFASAIFGLYLWDQNDVLQQMGALLEIRVPRSIEGFILMPYYAFNNIILLDQGAALIIGILYLSTLFFWLLEKSANVLLICCWLYLIAWFLGAQDPRYLMPIMPLVFVYFGIVVNAILNFIFPRFFPTIIRKIFSVIAVIITLLVLMSFIQQQFVKVLNSGVGDSAELIEQRNRQDLRYDLISHANEIFGEHATIYEFFMREIRWFFKGNVASNQFGPHGYARILTEAAKDNGGESPERLEKVLKEKYSAQGFIIPPPPNIIYDPEEFNKFFDLKYSNSEGSVYKFKD